VGGALARHAEETIDRIGSGRVPIVRELFRNLVTAEGTRAVRAWDELLSIFDAAGRHDAEEVLRELIDARLLTSYEVQGEDREPTRRVEIIHESLLANWPRLVRWQTQDADAVQLRDQLRQAARTWDERGRSDDLLWTGAAFREYQVWRERYPGGLTELEEDFARSMSALATRRRRRRRIAAVAGVSALLVVLAVVTMLWRRSELETRRAEAQKLIAMGQMQVEEYPTAALAHATASLELADSEEARLLALEALWKGPPAFVVSREHTVATEFSPDDRWLLQSIGRARPTELRLIGADGAARSLGSFEDVRDVAIDVDPDGTTFIAGGGASQRVVMWAPPDPDPVADLTFDGRVLNMFGMRGGGLRVSWRDGRALLVVAEPSGVFIDELAAAGSLRRLGRLELDQRPPLEWIKLTAVDTRSGRWLAAVTGGEVVVFEIGDDSVSAPRLLGRHEDCDTIDFDPQGRFFATADASGRIRLWDPAGDATPRLVDGPPGLWQLEVSDDGSLLVAVASGAGEHWSERGQTAWIWRLEAGGPRLLRTVELGEPGQAWWQIDPVGPHLARTGPDPVTRLWPLPWPADAEPVSLSGRGGLAWAPSFDHRGDWLVTSEGGGVAFWPVAWRHPAVIRRHDKTIRDLLFEAGGRWLASASMDGTVRLWPLEGEVPEPGRIVAQDDLIFTDLECSPDGRWLLSGAAPRGSARLLSLDGLEPRELTGFARGSSAVAMSFDGRLAAGSSGLDMSENMIRVWDLASGEEVQRLGVDEVVRTDVVEFTEDGRLLSGGPGGLTRWDVGSGASEVLFEGIVASFATSADARRVLLLDFAEPSGSSPRRVVFLDLDTGASRELESHGRFASGGSLALDPAGTIAVTAEENVVKVGRVTGGEPHLLLGHEGRVIAAAVDPLGRWIATAGEDESIRLWPMPDLSKPPLHTLPREELIAKLKTLTNVRVTRDPESSAGWSVTHDPFPGWETVPTW
jgi:WD40 repeat protein